MPRPATGQVVERDTREGITSYALRFRAYGQRRFVHLGYSPAWTRRRAEQEMADVLADVRRGLWRPPEDTQEPESPTKMPTLHEFASEWVAAREAEGLRPRTMEYLRWCLTDHLLPVFADTPLDRITIEAVDRYAQWKAAEGKLSNGSVNKTIEALAQVMAQAVEYGHVPVNPAAGKRRKLKTTKPERLFLEPAQVEALLDAASELDSEDRSRRRYRRPLLATLAFAGLRVGELLSLTWRDVNLATGHVRVRASKTDAGVRTVDVQPELRDELAAWKVSTRHGEPGDLVFPTSTGRQDNRNNVRRRVLVRAVERANERITDEVGCDRLPDGLSPHALRRSFASWLVAEGEDPAYVMAQLGHTDPKMTLGLYAKALQSKRRRPHARRAEQAADLALDPAERARNGH
jgi:integrase